MLGWGGGFTFFLEGGGGGVHILLEILADGGRFTFFGGWGRWESKLNVI